MTSPVYFTVEADFKAFIEDASSDSDYDPQVVPISATVTFTPLINAGDVVLATNASPRPTGFIPAPITAIIDPADGRLKMRTGTDAGATGFSFAPVRLLGSSALLELDGPLEYSARFSEVVFSNGRRGTIASFNFEAPNSDTVLNLIEVARVPGQVQSGITKIAPGAVRLEDGDIIFSFAGLDIPESIPFTPLFTSTEMTDSTTVGRAVITSVDAAAARTAIGAENAAMKGASGGYAPLDGTAKIDAAYLPSYVDDVLSYANQAAFPVTGETGKIYVANDNGDAFRWTGSAYLRISDRVTAAGITDSTTVGRALVTAASAPAARAAVDIDAVYVESFRDGVRTDHEILTAAFAAATAGSEVVFGPGVTYTLSETFAPVLTDKPGLTINGQGATLTGTATTLFSPSGTVFGFGSRPTVTAAITARTKTITVNSTAALQAGDLIQIYSDTEVYDSVTGTGGAVKAEMAQIRSVVNSTTIELEGRTWNTYSLTGHTVKLMHIRPMRDITIKDLTLQSANRTTLNTIGVASFYFTGLTYMNVRARGFTQTGIYCYGGINVNYLGCHATECSVEAWTDYGVGTIIGANGYGFWVVAVVGAKFIGCFGRRNRHTIDMHDSYDVTMISCTAENDRSSSFSTHGVSTTKIIGCTTKDSGGGIVVRGTNNTIIGNHIIGLILDADSGGQSYSTGIIVGLGTGNRGGNCADNLIIENNFIDISGYTTTAAATAGYAILLNSPARNARISGNTIKGFTQSAIAIRPILSSRGVDISNNLIDVSNQQGTGLSDGPVNRIAIQVTPTPAGVAAGSDFNIVNNVVTDGIPSAIVYVYGGSSEATVSERIRITGNRSANSCSSYAVYLDQYFGEGIEVYNNELVADPGPVFHQSAKFSSPLITNPISPSAPLATTTAIAAGSIEVGHASDTTVTRSAAGKLAVEGVDVVLSTRTVNSKALSSDVTLTQDDVASGTTNKVFTVTEQTKLAGIATGATANSSDATLLARANHTGTQLASTISDFSTAADARVAAGTTAATSKTTPVDADELPLVDSAASNALKKLTWSNLKATLKTYFDSVSTTLSAKSIALGSNTVTGTIAEFNTALTDGDFATLGGTETLTSKTLTSPRIQFIADNGGKTAIQTLNRTSSVNHFIVANSATGNNVEIGATGTDSQIGLDVAMRGTTKSVRMVDGSSNEIAIFTSQASVVNYVRVHPGTTGVAPYVAAEGDDTNVSLNLISKNAGTVQANGVAVSTNSTTATHTAQQIELGHASDTTIARSSAGVVTIEGNTVATRLTATATLDFGSVTAQSYADLTITVTGAATGDAVALGVPTAAVTAGIAYTAWVSAADTVTVRAHNYTAGALDPASGTFRATVIR